MSQSLDGNGCLSNVQNNIFCRLHDLNMAGEANALPTLFAKLNEKLKLDPATKIEKKLNLGCKQINVAPPTELVLEQGKFVEELKGSTLEKIDSAPQSKKSTNGSVDRGEPSWWKVHHEGG